MKKVRFFDAHAHIQDTKFDDDREAVLARMEESGIGALLVGTDREVSQQAVTHAAGKDYLWAVVGQHPTDRQDEAFDRDFYVDLIEKGGERIVGIGECGFDFYRGEKNKEELDRQEQVFRHQIRLAAHYDLPLMIHCRDAYEECIAVLKDEKKDLGDSVRGNIHFFAGNVDVARRFFDLGFTVSFTGVVSFTHDYDEVVRYAPLDRILAETDCPYVAPVPHRGKRNEPAYVVEVVKAIAAIKGEEEDTIRKKTIENTARVFGLPIEPTEE